MTTPPPATQPTLATNAQLEELRRRIELGVWEAEHCVLMLRLVDNELQRLRSLAPAGEAVTPALLPHIKTAVVALAYLVAVNEVTGRKSVFDAERTQALEALRDLLPENRLARLGATPPAVGT